MAEHGRVWDQLFVVVAPAFLTPKPQGLLVGRDVMAQLPDGKLLVKDTNGKRWLIPIACSGHRESCRCWGCNLPPHVCYIGEDIRKAYPDLVLPAISGDVYGTRHIPASIEARFPVYLMPENEEKATVVEP